MTSTSSPNSSNFFYDYTPSFETVTSWATNNFITRGLSSFRDGVYNAEEAVGDGVAHFGSSVYNYTLGETGFFTTMGQSGKNFLSSTRAYIYEGSPTMPTFMKNNSAVHMLSGAADAAGTTFSSWVSNITHFLSSTGSTVSSTGKFFGGYGESIYSFLLALGNKVQSAHQSGSLYKIAPLALGSIFAYFGLKNLARGTVGYDSLAIRKKMAYKALHEENLPFGKRIGLIRDSFFGSMPGKRRAVILARSIANLVAAALLIYPLFVKSPSPNTDIDNIESNNFRDTYLDSTAALDPNARRAHRLHTASKVYLSEKGKYDTALRKAEIDPKIQCFVEETLNPVSQDAGAVSVGNFTENAYDWTIGRAKGVFAPCKSFATPGHQTIFYNSEEGFTKVNTTRLNEVCEETRDFIKTSPKPLSIQFSDFVGAACNATVGYTPWANLCSKTREGLGKSIEEDRFVMTSAVNSMCDTLSKRGASNINLEKRFPLIPSNPTKTMRDNDPEHATSILKQRMAALNERVNDARELKTLTENEAQFKAFVEANGDALNPYFKSFLNMTQPEFTKKAFKNAYTAFSKGAHPDLFNDFDNEEKEVCQTVFQTGAALNDAIQANPDLLKHLQKNGAALAPLGNQNYYYTVKEIWENFWDAINPYSGVATEVNPSSKEEHSSSGAEFGSEQNYIEVMKKRA